MGGFCNAQRTKLVGVLKVVRVLYVSSRCDDACDECRLVVMFESRFM